MEKDVSPFMAEAIRLSDQGMRLGDGGPFGAVVVRGDEIVGRGWNRVLATNDPTAHAEIVAIRNACTSTGSYWLNNCRIYVNCEPCPMCLAAIFWARIKEVKFAATRMDAERIGFMDAQLYERICAPPAGEQPVKQCRESRDTAVAVMGKWLTQAGQPIY